jgi:hypothetical protein
VAASVSLAGTYYVSPTGSAGNDGTQASPWSLDKANSTMVAGDTAILMDGSYSSAIAPFNSGSDGSPITYRAAHSRQAVLITSNPRLSLSNRSYITVDGMYGDDGYRWAIGNYSSHLTINDCRSEEHTSELHSR